MLDLFLIFLGLIIFVCVLYFILRGGVQSGEKGPDTYRDLKDTYGFTDSQDIWEQIKPKDADLPAEKKRKKSKK